MQVVYLRAIVMGQEWGYCELANPVLVRGLLGIFEDKLIVSPIGVAKLMTLPESMSLTALSTETTSWRNEFAIPYPTYFHPSTDNEVFQWQTECRAVTGATCLLSQVPRDLGRLVLHEIKEIIPVSGASQREQSRSPY
ncbi:hypothetical protein NC651_005039 [Populus alba x Populus x berolinensis]|nr:hypothetical protein NC651_005039 [Populus alba x Populus x berolinensis]